MWSSHICSSERPSNKYFFLRTQENREPMQQDVYLSCIHPCPCPRQTKFVFVYIYVMHIMYVPLNFMEKNHIFLHDKTQQLCLPLIIFRHRTEVSEMIN